MHLSIHVSSCNLICVAHTCVIIGIGMRMNHQLKYRCVFLNLCMHDRLVNAMKLHQPDNNPKTTDYHHGNLRVPHPRPPPPQEIRPY